MTDFHNYHLPDQHSTDWHIPLNNNFQKIDVDVEIRDLDINRETYPPKENAKFLSTDTGRRYLGNGTDWIELTYPNNEQGTEDQIAEQNLVYTQDNDTVEDINRMLSNLSEEQHLVISSPVEVETTPIKHPSNTTIFVQAPIKQANNIEGDAIHLLQNDDPHSGNEALRLVCQGGYLNGNSENQSGADNHRHTISYENVSQLELHNVQVINQYDWGTQISRCEHVRVYGFYSQANGSSWNQDGLHFVDTIDVIGHDINGVAEDDILAITAKNRDVDRYTIHGLHGTSLGASGVRIHKAAEDLHDGNRRILSNISISDININSSWRGINLEEADHDTYFQNIYFQGQVNNASSHGIHIEGHLADSTFEVNIAGSGKRCVNMGDALSIKHCVFRGQFRDPAPSSFTIEGGLNTEIEDCSFDLHCVRSNLNTDPFKGHIFLPNGQRNRISGHYTGGDRCIQLGEGDSRAQYTMISDIFLGDLEGETGIAVAPINEKHTFITDYIIYNADHGIGDLDESSIDTANGIYP